MKIKITDILIVLIILVPLGLFIGMGSKPPFVDDKKILEKHLLDYSAGYNFRQTVNDCGPYNVAAVVRTLTGKEVDSSKFAESMKYRLPNKYVLPWGVENQLKENGLNIETPNFRPLSDNDKILYLQERISRGRPVIVLGKKDSYQHYLTVLGFDSNKGEFYVYDSAFDAKKSDESMTLDKNGALPGNVTMTNDALINFWRSGGMYGIYKWYAVSAWIGNDEENKK